MKRNFFIMLWLLPLVLLLPPSAAQEQTPAISYQWQNVALQGMGFVTGVLIHPLEPDRMYLRTDVGGIFRWNAQRQSWIALPLSDSIESFALDPHNPDTLYAAVGLLTQSEVPGQLVKSTDGGLTWTTLSLPPLRNGGNELWRGMGERLIVDPNNSAVVYFGSRQQGLWRSLDAGLSWTQMEIPYAGDSNLGVVFVAIDAQGGLVEGRSKILYYGAGGHGGIYRSTDGGTSWRRLGEGAPPARLSPARYALTDAGRFYVTFSSYQGEAGGVYRIERGADTWTDITPNNGATHWYNAIAVDPANPDTVLIFQDGFHYDGLYRSVDAGASWNKIPIQAVERPAWYPLNWHLNSPVYFAFTSTLLFDPHHPGTAWVADGFGIYQSQDILEAAAHFTAKMRGMEELVAFQVAMPPGGALYSMHYDMIGFRHDSLTEPPQRSLRDGAHGIGTSIAYSAGDPDVLAWVGSSIESDSPTGYQAYSTDGGQTWQEFATTPEQNGREAWQGNIAISATDSQNWVYAAMFTQGMWQDPAVTGVYYTRDGGQSWQRSRFPDTNTTFSGADDASMFGLYVKGSHVLTADTVNGDFYVFIFQRSTILPSVYRSSDGGATFELVHQHGSEDISHELPMNSWHVLLKAEPGTAGALWLSVFTDNGPNTYNGIAGETGLYHSRDGGLTWTLVPTMEKVKTFGFGAPAPGRTNPALYVQGRLNGAYTLFRSDDVTATPDRATWTAIKPPNDHFLEATDLTGDLTRYGVVYAAVNGRGVWMGAPGWQREAVIADYNAAQAASISIATVATSIPDNALLLYQTDAPPVPDGEVDAIWEAVTGVTLASHNLGAVDNEQDLSAIVKLLYDAENLYVLFEVTDDVVVDMDNDAQPYMVDSAEVYIDGDNGKRFAYDRNDGQYLFRLNGEMWIPQRRDVGVMFVPQITETGYRVELVLPWINFDITPTVNQIIGLELQLNDNDGGEQRQGKLAWFTDVDQSWTDPSTFGTAVLTGEKITIR